jgi:hypothetical protein
MKPVLSEDSKRLLEAHIEKPSLVSTPTHKPLKKEVLPEVFAKMAKNTRQHREKKRR